MGQVLLKTDINQVTNLTQEWCLKNNFSIKHAASTGGDQNTTNSSAASVTARNRWYRLIWRYYQSDGGISADLQIRMRTYLDIIFCSIIISGFWSGLFNIGKILSFDLSFAQRNLSFIALSVSMVTLWLMFFKFGTDAAAISADFWKKANRTFDCIQLAPIDNNSSFCQRVTIIFCCCILFYSAAVFFGVLFSLVFLLPLLVIALLWRYCTRHKNNPQWSWRIWIMTNMFTWNRLMLMVILTMAALSAVEVCVNFAANGSYRDMPLQITVEHFRKNVPAKARMLEQNCFDCIYKIAEKDFCRSGNTYDPEIIMASETWISKRISFYSQVMLWVIIAAVSVSFVPFLSLITKRPGDWQSRRIEGSNLQTPSMPYFSQSWRVGFPAGMRTLILIHIAAGMVINLIGITFCIEGWSYLFLGKTLIFDNIANLWSWLFAIPKMVFGTVTGEIIAAFLMVMASLPALILLITFTMRMLSDLRLLIRLSRNTPEVIGQDKDYLFVVNYVSEICREKNISVPEIILTNDKTITLNVQYLFSFRKPVLQISTGVLNLLSHEELRVAIAHEIGHIKQGLWKIALLRYLSSIALFPNHYLTLCIDWPRKEIDADRFAIEATKDAKSLKQALVKISTAQISCSVLHQDNNHIANKETIFKVYQTIFRNKIRTIVISLKFYFGDGLLGYTYPHLSERLQAIDASSTQEI